MNDRIPAPSPAIAYRLTIACLLTVVVGVVHAVAQESPPPESPSTSPEPQGQATRERAPMTAAERQAETETIRSQFKENAPPDVYQAGIEAVEQFEAKAEELQAAVLEMRQQHTRLANGLSEDREAYRLSRNQSRDLINGTYEAALDVLNYFPHPDATRFVVTVIENRSQRDVYNASTLEGAAKLLDLGVRWVYVAQAAARSAISVGDFELAERLYKRMKEDDLGDTDKRLIVQAEEIAQQFQAEQELQAADADSESPKVVFHTTRGDFTVELFLEEAPSTVSHFIELVESGFYDGLDFFQVIDGLLALTGDPLGDGSSRPDRYIADEHERDDARMPLTGSLVMAKLPLAGGDEFVPNSAGTQFAILYTPLPPIVKAQTVFGRVSDGMDVVGALRRVDPHKKKDKNEIVLPPDRILSAEVIDRPKQLPEVRYAEPPAEMPR